MADQDLPYRVEYSKSGRAGCKVCNTPIPKDVLRIATVVQSPFHDGKMERWHHAACFFKKQRPKTEGDIAHFDSIRWEDQEFIRKQIAANSANGAAAEEPAGKGAKGRKRAKSTGGAANAAYKDYKVEYAKSSRSTCRGCQETIIKQEVRVSKKDYESDDARKYGGLDRWHHLECFAKLRDEFGFFDDGKNIPGADALSAEDKAALSKALPKMKEADIPPAAKKMKDEPKDDAEEKELKKQNKAFFKMRDDLSDLSKKIHVELLEANSQVVPTGNSEVLDALADAMLFGALELCPKCGGNFEYKSGLGYKCTGNVSEWAKCENVTQDPKRKKFVVPEDLKDECDFLRKYKSKVKRRLIKITAPSTSSAVKKEDEVDGPKIEAKPRPLKHLDFVISSKTHKSKEELKREILLLGGQVRSKVYRDTAAVISTPEQVEKMSSVIHEANIHDVHVVSEDFVEEAKEFTDAPFMLIKKKSIASWGGDPQTRVSKSVAAKSASKGKSKYEKSSGTVKLQIKGGGAVDPDSGLSDTAHVYQRGKDKYTTTLGITDIQTKKNSYYKLQILKDDKREKYWLFRSWGRIGTTIGNNKLEDMALENCIQKFEELYEEKSGNPWCNRDRFVKMPGRMYPVDIDHGEEEDTSKLLESNIESKLKKPVQDLIKLIFDVNTMKKAMLEFEIDMDKMPLGKISKKQIQKAYSVLTELSNLIKNGDTDRTKYIEATNKFYTLIPHSFGIDVPSIIETEKEVQTKSEMLESLLEMEIAYNLLHAKTDASLNPLDGHYDQLKTTIDVLDRESEEFKLVEKYVKNTHAETHRQYDLIIEDVFVAKRQGEESRFKPFKKLHNRKLLWHGSRTTNFAGILSQGLRIAPPEAPVTGYMFGKGIYFADMVSKSANYCCTNSQNSTGLLLLCDVALGNTYERYNADYIEKLPHGKHSTWGRGQTWPDPEKSVKLPSGVEVPCGPAIRANLKEQSSLLYNEFIVYDVAQVKVEYLVKLNFKYKY